MKQAILVLEDGTVFSGKSFGATGECTAEVVFNTSMTGYQEILTDPSYYGQIITMTYPLIGNYGINNDDFESQKAYLSGFIVKENSKIYSNWRATSSLDEFLKKYNVLGIEGIDTRALTLHIREAGAMKAVISTECFDEKLLHKKAKASLGLVGRDIAKPVSTKAPFEWSKKGKHKIVVLDLGVKFNILRELANLSSKVTVVPIDYSVEEILKLKPDGILISNGPGDPAALDYVVKTTQELLNYKLPMFGICFGQQILGLAFGGKTYKLKFGHHGANQPVKDLKTGRIAITVQNHGFCVDINSFKDKDIEITHVNLNDQTLEGIRHKKLPVFSVQFHPEASAGPHDANYLFKEFINSVEKHAKKKRY
ncbi:MAG: glutamine-hydrolyzing carbamoyl-phosphate synthase small subunit [Candidatus Omnitrophota bacterium]